MSHTVVLREYGDPVTVELSTADAVALRSAADGKLNVDFGNRPGTVQLSATSFVGTVVTSAATVLVRPKVELANLFYMLGVDPPKFDHSEFRYASDLDLLSIMAVVFAHQVDIATVRGVVRGYRHTEERLLAPRGRVDFVQQLRSPGIVSPIPCRFDEYTADVFANRVLVAALDRLCRVPALAPATRTSIARLRQRFEDVASVAVLPANIARWQPDRLNQHYGSAMRLAGLILSGLSLVDEVGRFPAGSFFIDMNELFQTFVADRLRRYLSPTIELIEEPPAHLGVGGRLRMAPDLVMRSKGRDVYVGDVKYKLATGPARMADYYQLLAYATALDLGEGVLVYAQNPGDLAEPTGGTELVHSVRVRNTDKTLHVYRLPLTGTNNELELGLVDLAEWIALRARVGGLRRAA